MNRLFVLFIFILISSTILADEIEILLDIPGKGPEIKNHDKIEVNYRGTFVFSFHNCPCGADINACPTELAT